MNKHEIICENCDKKKKASLLLNKENIGWSKTTDYIGDPLYFCSKNCKSNYVLTEVLPLFNENRQKITTFDASFLIFHGSKFFYTMLKSIVLNKINSV